MVPFDADVCARVAELARAFDLDLVVLFGSRATGRAHEESDVDLAVRRTRGVLDFRQLLDLTGALADLRLGAEVDVVDLRRADPLLLRKIFESAVPLFAAPGAFSEERLRAFHRYQDYRPFLRMEREAVRRALAPYAR